MSMMLEKPRAKSKRPEATETTDVGPFAVLARSHGAALSAVVLLVAAPIGAALAWRLGTAAAHTPEARLYAFVVLGALGLFCVALVDPVRDFLQTRAAWRYAEKSEQVRLLSVAGANKLRSFLAPAALLTFMLLALLALALHLVWLGDPDAGQAAKAAFYASPLILALLALRWRLAVEAVRLLAEAERIARRTPGALRDFSASRNLQALKEAPPVTHCDAKDAFRAGGVTWDLGSLSKNVVVFGQTGVGKTVCVLNAFLDGLVGLEEQGLSSSGLILDPKGDFRGKLEMLGLKHGRARDVVTLDLVNPERSFHWNPFDCDDEAKELAARFAAVGDMITPPGQNDAFFLEQRRIFLTHAITLLRAAWPERPPAPRDLYDLATWRMEKGPETGLGLADERAAANPSQEVADARAYLWDLHESGQERRLADVSAFVANLLSDFIGGPLEPVFEGRSTALLGALIDKGRILYTHMPLARFPRMGVVVGGFLRLAYQREILRRPRKPRPSFFFCDEFQNFVARDPHIGDAAAFAMTRESGHANVVATQNVSGLLARMRERAVADTLLGNCATKIFLRNDDAETNKAVARLFGSHREPRVQRVDAPFSMWRGQTSTLSIGAPEPVPTVPDTLFGRLAVPSREATPPLTESVCSLGAENNVSGPRRLYWKIHPIEGEN